MSAGFLPWLRATGGSLVATSPATRRIVVIPPTGRPVAREFDVPACLASSGRSLAIAGDRDITLFQSDRRAAAEHQPGQPPQYDTFYLPRMTWHVGPVSAADLAFGAEGLWFVSSRYSCLARLSADFSFEPQWRPKFISRLTPEDRCHLNGLALAEGQPAFATALAETDAAEGWRQHAAEGGVLIDVRTNEIVQRGLSLPQSPRWHGETLYFLESGRGEVVRYDPTTGERKTVSVLPGFLSGMSILGPFAIVSLSRVNPWGDAGRMLVVSRFPQLRCGVSIVDLRNGREAAFAEFAGGIAELSGIAFLPGTMSPNLVTPARRGDRDAVTAPDFADWIRRGRMSQDESLEA